MAPGFQSSFIPKEPITPDVFKKKKAGILGIVAVSTFISTIIIAGALTFYKSIVKNDIENLRAELAQAEQSIDKKTIKEMLDFSRKLSIAKSIVTKHQVVSGFMQSLASSTVATVTFNDFSYNALTPNGLNVTLKGKTNSYASVALQESVFLKNKYWKSVSISNLTLGDKGTVNFDVAVSVDPQIALYQPPVIETKQTEILSPVVKDSDSDDLDSLGSEIENI